MSKTVATAQPSESNTSIVGPTVEQTGYALLLLAALVLRFLRLGSTTPLNPLEAGQAWTAWADTFGQGALLGQGNLLTAPAPSPLLYTVQRFLFWLTEGGSDGWARFLPALAGGLLVLLPWLLRDTLGRPTALALALLIAVDPWLLTFSRTGDGAILSIGLGLLLFAVFTHPQRVSSGARPWLAGGIGLFLISGPLAWLLVPVLAGAIRLFGVQTLWPAERPERARLLTVAGVTILAGATGFLSHWDGLGNISASLSVALASLTTDAGYPLGWGFVRLAVDQPLLLLIGGAGLIAFWLRPAGDGLGDGRWRLLLTGWLVWGVFLLFLPGRNPAALLLLGLPLLLGAAHTAVRLLAYATRQVHWQDGSLILATVAVLLVTTAFWTNHYNSQWSNSDFDRLTLFFYGIVPVLVLFFVWWAGWRTSSQMFVLLGLPLLFLASVGSGWAINQPGDTTKGSALFAQTAQPGLKMLTADVTRLSSLRAIDPYEALVLVDVEPGLRPLLGWELRSMRNLRFVESVDPALLTDRAALVVTDNADTALLPGGYRGSRYPVLDRWLPTDLTGAGTVARWILLRELKTAPPTTSVVLWAREE